MKIIDLLDIIDLDEKISITDTKNNKEIISYITAKEIPEKFYNYKIKRIYSYYGKHFISNIFSFPDVYTYIVIEI